MTRLNDERIVEIGAKLASYGFKDHLGHSLTNCQDFQDLLAEVKALRMEKAQAKAERDVLDNTWQPIGTAPKDGTPVLLCCLTSISKQLLVVARYKLDQWIAGSILNGITVSYPTHWMPLPATPEQTNSVSLIADIPMRSCKTCASTLQEEHSVWNVATQAYVRT